MIESAFDPSSEPIITPGMIYGEKRHLCKTCIVTFSENILQNVLESYDCTQIARIGACNGSVPIYGLRDGDRTIAVYLSGIGSAVAATDIIEAGWLTGAENFIVFGSAGNLNREATAGKLIVPTAAYRDEGLSYHYAPAAPYIEMPGAKRVAEVFDRLGIPYVQGRTWTTDAIYRETRARMLQRREEGCLCVEMEAAGAQAVCSHYGFGLYYFLMTGDVLDLPEWEAGELRQANHCLDNFRLALEIAREVDK